MSPAVTRALISRKVGSNRRLKPSITNGALSLIAAQVASMRAMSRSIGFSHSTFLPASTASRRRSVWVAVADAIRTASTDGSAMASPGSGLALAPYRPARFVAASRRDRRPRRARPRRSRRWNGRGPGRSGRHPAGLREACGCLRGDGYGRAPVRDGRRPPMRMPLRPWFPIIVDAVGDRRGYRCSCQRSYASTATGSVG